MQECLSRIRQHGESEEQEFDRAVADLPEVLRELAAVLEAPTDEVRRRIEAPGCGGYSLWALSYDEEMDNPVVLGEEEIIRQVVGPAEGLSVLDVGCGTGRHAVPLAAQGARVIGLDPTPEMLDRARAKAQAAGVEVDLQLGGIDSLSEALGQFDLVLCCLVLSHVEALGDAVARLAAHVARGGRLVVSDFHPINLLLGFRTAFRHEGQPYIVPNFLHPVSEYFSAMRDAGLVVTRIDELGSWERLPGVPTTLLMEASRAL
jgi:2-polyprenyl-3-methyl-5-hydroxy-6-metoxy-1,4-benzoquinol methylase